MNIRKYLNNQNWNIGFSRVTPEILIKNKRLPKIHWMKHSYKDRFFADPFILDSDSDFIYLLAEELIFWEKGTIVWLKVSKTTFKLIDRQVILKSDTHLSYPHIVNYENKTFIIPENSESGKLTIYEFDNATKSLTPITPIADEPLTDATLLTYNGKHYLLATELPSSQKDAYLYEYDASSKKFRKVQPSPIIVGDTASRMGGAFFEANGKTYRPAQDCSNGYGKALTILQVDAVEPSYAEHPIFRIEPQSWRYHLGLHTLNFDQKSGFAVVDSYGYQYPIIGRILMNIRKLKYLFNGR